MYTSQIYIVLIALFTTGVVTSPILVSANYTLHGRTFETKEELQSYVVEYVRVWEELHGSKSGSSQTYTSNASTHAQLFITTRNVSDITKEGARFQGTINFHQSKVARIWFDYGFTPNSLVYRTETEVLKTKTGASPFDRKVLYLLPRTTYYYRATGLNEDGIFSYGEIKSFTTGVDPKLDTALVRVKTGSANNLDDNRGTLRGTIDFRKAPHANVWFEYSDEEGDLYQQTPRERVYKLHGKNYEYSIRNLDDETTYYFRMVAQDSDGDLSYGKTARFKTKRDIPNEKPKVTTSKAQEVSVHSATLAGTVDMNDSSNGVVFLVYGEDQKQVRDVAKEYTRYKNIHLDGDALQTLLLDSDLDSDKVFEKNIQYLDLNTKHYYAIGLEYENAEGDDVLLMGKTQSFTTTKR